MFLLCLLSSTAKAVGLWGQMFVGNKFQSQYVSSPRKTCFYLNGHPSNQETEIGHVIRPTNCKWAPISIFMMEWRSANEHDHKWQARRLLTISQAWGKKNGKLVNKSWLDIRKSIFTIKLVKHSHRLSREVVVPHPWRHSRSGWMGLWAPDGAVGVPAHCWGAGMMAFKCPFQLEWFCVIS